MRGKRYHYFPLSGGGGEGRGKINKKKMPFLHPSWKKKAANPFVRFVYSSSIPSPPSTKGEKKKGGKQETISTWVKKTLNNRPSGR